MKVVLGYGDKIGNNEKPEVGSQAATLDYTLNIWPSIAYLIQEKYQAKIALSFFINHPTSKDVSFRLEEIHESLEDGKNAEILSNSLRKVNTRCLNFVGKMALEEIHRMMQEV
eukprot:gene6177-6891_t